MSEWLDVRTHEDYGRQMRILNADTGETRVIPPDEWPDGLGPDAAPEPSVEQMIEEMGGVTVLQVGPFEWAASPNPTIGFDLENTHDSPKSAIAALYRAWRERE